MNKENIFLFIILLFFTLPFVIGNGGNTYVENFSKCDNIRITFSGTLPIDDGEYIVRNNCTGYNNTWVCKCTNNWKFIVTFLPNTLNIYTINYQWNYTEKKSTKGKNNKKRIIILPYENESNTTGTNITRVEETPLRDMENQSRIKDSKGTNGIRNQKTTIDTGQKKNVKSDDVETKDIKQDIPLDNTVDGIPWWIIVISIILFLFGIIMLVIYFIFKEPIKKKTTNQEINDILKQFE